VNTVQRGHPLLMSLRPEPFHFTRRSGIVTIHMKSCALALAVIIASLLLPGCVQTPIAETHSIEVLNHAWRVCLQREADIAGTAPYATERVVEITFEKCMPLEAQLIRAHENRAQGMVSADYLQRELRSGARGLVVTTVESSRARRAQ
jgi:hypothetical protein